MKNKLTLLILALFLMPRLLFSQEECGYYLINSNNSNDPQQRQSIEEFENQLACYRTAIPANDFYRVRVAVHVIHDPQQSYGTANNITDEQIFDMIDHLNLGFRNKYPNATGFDSKIEFCLAQTDPNGNATTGITRHPIANFGGVILSNGESNFIAIKQSTGWDRTRYLNMRIKG